MNNEKTIRKIEKTGEYKVTRGASKVWTLWYQGTAIEYAVSISNIYEAWKNNIKNIGIKKFYGMEE